MNEKRQLLEALFERYGAAATEFDRENRERFGDGVIYEYGGVY